MSRMKKAGIGLMAGVPALLLAVVLLVTTTPGLHLLLSAAVRWVPGLEIGQVEGGWRDLTLNAVRYQMPGVTVQTDTLHLALAPDCLWRSQLCLDDLSLQNLTAAINTRDMPPAESESAAQTAPVTEISAPVAVALRRVNLSNSRITVDGVDVSLSLLQTGLSWQGRSLTLLPTQVSGLAVALPVAPKTPSTPPATTGKPQPLGETLRALFAAPLLPTMPEFTLPLDLTIVDLRGESWQIQGSQSVTLSRFQLQAATRQQTLTLQQLTVQSPQGALYAHGNATLAGDWPVALNVNGTVNSDPLKGERLRLTAEGSLRRQLRLAVNLSGPQRAQLDIQTALAESGLPLNVSLHSPQLRWPLTGEAQYQFNDVQLNIGGKATDYSLALRGDIRGRELPPGTLTLEGRGSEQQFALTRLRLAALQGTADITGQLDWRDAINWNGNLTLKGVNTAQQWPEWPARLEGSLITRGSLAGEVWQLDVPQLALDGQVRQNKVMVKGALSGNAGGQWSIPGITLALGRNQLTLQGELNDQWRLNGDINAPSLNGTLPGLGGQVMGTLRLSGKRDAPQLQTEINATALRWQELSLGKLTLNGDVQSDKQLHGTLTLQLQQLTQGNLRLASLNVRAAGDENQHQLRLTMNGESVGGQLLVGGRLLLNGHFDREQQRWQGELSDTRFNTPVGEWRLAPAMPLVYQAATQKVTVGAHCWRNPDAELCVPQPIDAGASGKASVNLNRFNLAMLKPFIGQQTAVSGTVTGSAQVSWQANGGLPDAHVTLAGNGVTVRQQVQGGTLPVAFDALTLEAGLQRGQARLAWLMGIQGNGRFRGDVQIADPQRRRNLSGTVTLNALSLDLLRPILRQNEKAAGIANADLRLGGDLQRPQVFGQLTLDNLDVDGSWMPVDVTSGRLALLFNGMSSTLQGVFRTTQGQINAAGNADWSVPEAWRARIAVNGDRLRVTVPPMARLDVSPDIAFEATPQLLTLNGTVTIPWARIVVHDMPASAVDVSSDEVILDARRRPTSSAASAIPIASNLIVRVGDDVWLDAYGLRARLRGDLNVTQDTQGLGLNGQISMPEGRFKAYGQDLQVRKGQLLFSGPPTQPVLNIEAIRNPDNTADSVTVGVRVTGTAAAPKLEVFSEPTLSQEEALSYLLRGQGLNSSGTDSSMMTSALIGLGVAQSGQVVGKIGEAFGVSNLALDTQGVGDKSQVVVSGYVLPGLQVKYGVGVFDSLATLTLRYRLMPKLYLEAVSGVNQALDVLYQFEF
ncbi:autotransporter assembly complex protein TamB [Dickeya dianthicola]|uniref:Translocation/assembly module TamB n=5 Tax=Dickeya dianthicola TaxID=204039 RepID=A0AAP2D7V8_9GAMM|nr:translocation/assembly module TamB domain-containing protein [Dickeya dianthicola]MBI0437864.1 translocation/assembly module TamB [Dickeya dianthicola]MBI0448067.1 translocation/assembly module TamB [Dickeya dianthicola]MBI0452630.1 translocation/assembly module TamB [Dickeya dianthicola]MBI0456111.1 translocation/assembly module TamB [Dickeya dianthicola]MBI0461651.1 translocation/assembly module TamB [Dickeya dianthicola]